MPFIVYKHTCLVTNKSYIGYTRHTIDYRWRQHIKHAKMRKCRGRSYFQNAILKYGVAEFAHEILLTCDSIDEALSAEKRLIEGHNTRMPHGYNMAAGGRGGGVKGRKWTAEQRAKSSAKLRGRIFSAEHRANISKSHADVSGDKNPFFGKKHSEEARQKIAARPYRQGADHHFYGKKILTSFKEGAKHPRSMQITIDGIEYGSLTLAAKALGMSRTKLNRLYR